MGAGMFSQQRLDGPTANTILYFGLKAETAKVLNSPESEWPNALRLLCRYWSEYHHDRKLQETMKLIAICRNFEEVGGGYMHRAFSSWNGKPVLVTRSGTVY